MSDPSGNLVELPEGEPINVAEEVSLEEKTTAEYTLEAETEEIREDESSSEQPLTQELIELGDEIQPAQAEDVLVEESARSEAEDVLVEESARSEAELEPTALSVDPSVAAPLPPTEQQTVIADDTLDEEYLDKLKYEIPRAASSALNDLENLVANNETVDETPEQLTNIFQSLRTTSETQPLSEETDKAEINQDENVEAMQSMDPNHPLLARVQAALRQRLQEKSYQLDLELREKNEMFKKATSHRETVGLDLYQTQQHLARLQTLLDNSQLRFEETASLRKEVETSLDNLRKRHDAELDSLKEREEKLEKQRFELGKVRRNIKQFELYREELQSRISLTKRVTLKTEEDIGKTEISKKRQDFYIDQLNENQRRLREQLSLYEHQLRNQQKESVAAHETLQDATTEMEAITFEKKQLLNQWKSSLIALQRRDDMLRSLENATELERENLRSMNMEFNGLKQSLKTSEERREKLNADLERYGTESQHIEKQIQALEETKEKLQENYAMYTKALIQSENELTKAVQEKSRLQKNLAQIHKLIHSLNAATQKIEMDIMEELQSQAGCQKQKSGSKRDGIRLKTSIYEKLANVAQLQNELSRQRLDAINVSTEIENLKQQYNDYEQKIQDQNAIIEKFENEIKRQSDELNKKQSDMTLLNKKLEHLVAQHAANEGASMGEVGPLEATIHNLQKSIIEQEKLSIELQQYWLKVQNDLVSVTKNVEDAREYISDAKMKKMVMERKKTVINAQFEREEFEIKDLNRNIRKIQADMIKINVLLSKHSKVQQQFEENNLNLEYEFRGRLKDAELECVELEQTIDRLRDEKDQALTGLVDAERQVMLWEKKIQLGKETLAALDPKVGASEIREMEKEIHRMKLRLSQLTKVQEKLVVDMERAIYRHGDISEKATRLRTGVAKNGFNSARYAAQKEINELARRIQLASNEIVEIEDDTTRLIDTQQHITKQIKETENTCKRLEERQNLLQLQLEKKSEKKLLAVNETNSLQIRARRLLDLKGSKYAFAVKFAEAREEELQKQREKTKKIFNMAKELQEDYGGIIEIAYRDAGLNAFLKAENKA